MFYLYMCVLVLINDSAENLSAFLHRGQVYMTLRRWRQAMADFEAVIKLDRWCPSLLQSVTKGSSFSFVAPVQQAISWGYIYWSMKLFESYFSKDLFLGKSDTKSLSSLFKINEIISESSSLLSVWTSLKSQQICSCCPRQFGTDLYAEYGPTIWGHQKVQ